ncbi:hypothetical protein ACS5PU_02505 [Pedobacter sp. GSP4]|uniref:hypothetical protein n=1 Tax=Pedobacter sp. GSP4 TaxID=3453716 RepID=UPI003EE96574
MAKLREKEGLAGELLAYLDEQARLGFSWVVYDSERPIGGSWDLLCYRDQISAFREAAENQQISGWHIARPIAQLRRAFAIQEYELKNLTMNRNSLEAFREEAKALKVPQNMIDAAEALMEQNVPRIEIFGQVPADRGMMDVTIHIKQSGQSDFYYFNKFDVAMSKAKPLENDHQYMVISQSAADKDKNLLRRFSSPIQAMDYFKAQKGNAELSTGKASDKDLQYRDTLATMKDGKVDYVKKEFSQTFHSPVIQNSHYVDRGKGFSIEQAANMLQGRAVFRGDLVSRAGVPYKAWNTYQFNEPKDRYNNYTLKQYGEGYRFDLKKELASYEIKEMQQPVTAKQLVARMENGYSPVVTVIGKDGESRPLRIEAVPRYGNINFSEPGGKPVKREDYQKEQVISHAVGKEKGHAKNRGQQQGQEIDM